MIQCYKRVFCPQFQGNSQDPDHREDGRKGERSADLVLMVGRGLEESPEGLGGGGAGGVQPGLQWPEHRRHPLPVPAPAEHVDVLHGLVRQKPGDEEVEEVPVSGLHHLHQLLRRRRRRFLRRQLLQQRQ